MFVVVTLIVAAEASATPKKVTSMLAAAAYGQRLVIVCTFMNSSPLMNRSQGLPPRECRLHGERVKADQAPRLGAELRAISDGPWATAIAYGSRREQHFEGT
jgi:hypothetical protein